MQATMDDRQLVTLAREGDQDAFTRLARARLLLRKLLLQKGNLPTGSPSNQLGRKGGMSK